MESKSWFQRWNFKQENINTQNEQEKEKEFNYIINDRPLNSVKADLIHAFLSVRINFLKFKYTVPFPWIFLVKAGISTISYEFTFLQFLDAYSFFRIIQKYEKNCENLKIVRIS
jgi:hypothetical protein